VQRSLLLVHFEAIGWHADILYLVMLKQSLESIIDIFVFAEDVSKRPAKHSRAPRNDYPNTIIIISSIFIPNPRYRILLVEKSIIFIEFD
jgi:hypothetical protein